MLAAWRAAHDLDADVQPVIALRSVTTARDGDPSMHQHRKGQMVMALKGCVVCEVPSGFWMVPPHGGVWIPGGVPHRMDAHADTDVCLLLIEPAATTLPGECCSLTISPMVREMILHLAARGESEVGDERWSRLVAVLLDELSGSRTQHLYVPVSAHPAVRRLADRLLADPADRRTASGWAHELAMSERTLTRLIARETGMSFGRWRQQLQIIVSLRLLSSGTAVQSVAETLGYQSVSAFITMFRRTLGKSPTRYLADHRTAAADG